MHAVCVTRTSPADSSCTTAVLWRWVGGRRWKQFHGVKKKSAAFEDWLCECEVGCMMKLRDGILKHCNVSK